MAKSTIHIKKSRKGSLRRIAKAKKGQPIAVSTLTRLAKSKNPKTRRKAQFAINARSFRH